MAVDKFPHTERGIRRTFYLLVPCGDGMSSVKKSPINQRIAPIWGKKGCVFQFPQKTHAETDLPQG